MQDIRATVGSWVHGGVTGEDGLPRQDRYTAIEDTHRYLIGFEQPIIKPSDQCISRTMKENLDCISSIAASVIQSRVRALLYWLLPIRAMAS
jgi:hypothetical protein